MQSIHVFFFLEVLTEFAKLVSNEQPGKDENGLTSINAHPLPSLLRWHSIFVDKENCDDYDDEKDEETYSNNKKSNNDSSKNPEKQTNESKTEESNEANVEKDSEIIDHSRNTNETETITGEKEPECLETAIQADENNITSPAQEIVDAENEKCTAETQNDATEPTEHSEKTDDTEKARKSPEDLAKGENRNKTQNDLMKEKEHGNHSDTSKPGSRTDTPASLRIGDKIKVRVSPIWTPKNKRANAALIYLYFRNVGFIFIQLIKLIDFNKLEIKNTCFLFF